MAPGSTYTYGSSSTIPFTDTWPASSIVTVSPGTPMTRLMNGASRPTVDGGWNTTMSPRWYGPSRGVSLSTSTYWPDWSVCCIDSISTWNGSGDERLDAQEQEVVTKRVWR